MIETGFARAKINISLDITSKLDNGFHCMKMVMQTVGLCDEISVECEPGEGFAIDPGMPFLPPDERNTAAKAAQLFFGYTGISGYRTRIRVRKKIPVCAGLGGGSADGACVLRLLDTMFATGLKCCELEKIGGAIGSDVPFCVAGGTALAGGRGDLLTALPPIPPCHIVICKPPFANSTPELFKRVKCEKIRSRPDTEGIIAALGKGSIGDVARRMDNVFEDILTRGAKEIADIKFSMLDHGALGSVMTGTGPAVFGMFDDGAKAREAYERLNTRYRESYLTETAGRLDGYTDGC